MKKQTYISIKANRPNSVKIWVGAVVFPNKHKTLKHCKLELSKLKTPANNAKQKLQNHLYEKPKRVAEFMLILPKYNCHTELVEASKEARCLLTPGFLYQRLFSIRHNVMRSPEFNVICLVANLLH